MLLSTFRENCAKKREDFFSDPLVRYLWNNIFMHEVPEVLSNHTRWIKSDPKYGDIAIQKFVICLKQLEKCNIRFSHDGSSVDVNSIELFSQTEVHNYLVNNGKFNKRNRA